MGTGPFCRSSRCIRLPRFANLARRSALVLLVPHGLLGKLHKFGRILLHLRDVHSGVLSNGLQVETRRVGSCLRGGVLASVLRQFLPLPVFDICVLPSGVDMIVLSRPQCIRS